MRPVNQARNGCEAARQRLDLADLAAGVGVGLVQVAVGIEPFERRLVRRQHAHVGEAEIGDQRVAIGQRLLEMLAGVEEEHRQRAVDAGDHVEQHGRIRAEGRHRRDLAGEMIAHRPLDDLLGRSDVRRARRGWRPRPAPRFGLRRPWLRQHRAPP